MSILNIIDLLGRLVVSPDGRRIATANADRTVRVWEAALPQQVIGNVCFSSADDWRFHGPSVILDNGMAPRFLETRT